jgi:uncharacterized protein (TIGR00255 family)
MTGVGRAETSLRHKKAKLTIEIRSANHKFMEMIVKLPNSLLGFESVIREIVSKNIYRGSLQLMANISGANSDKTSNHNETNYPTSFTLDYDMLANLLNIQKELKEKYRLDGELNINTVLAFPGVVVPAKQVEPDKNHELWSKTRATIIKALTALNRMKREEGAFLYKDFARRIKIIMMMLKRIEKRSRQIRQELHKKLPMVNYTRIDNGPNTQVELLNAQKATTEELVRLSSHTKAFMRAIQGKSFRSVGRKLEFILSEMLRETETILAKGRDTLISRDGIAIKEEVDALREQVRNVE